MPVPTGITKIPALTKIHDPACQGIRFLKYTRLIFVEAYCACHDQIVRVHNLVWHGQVEHVLKTNFIKTRALNLISCVYLLAFSRQGCTKGLIGTNLVFQK